MDRYILRPFALALFVASSASEATAEQQVANDMDAPFVSVLRHKTNVFASNKEGLFRADLESRQWRKLRLPVGMPLGGRFGEVPKESSTLIYVVSDRFGRSLREGTHGIYASRDSGETWSLLSKHHDYGPVLLLPSGSLFAVTNPSSSRGPTQIHMSKDMGATWRNISGKSGGVFGIFPDPDHPNQICLRISCIREYILQADDERYRWNWIVGLKWHHERLSSKEFFARSYSYSFRAPPTLSATLRNYFEYDFGDRAKILAIDLSLDEPRINVAQGEGIVVPITIQLLGDTASRVKLIDSRSSSAAWGIRVEYQGQRIATPAKGHDFYRAKDRDAMRQRLRSETTWTDISLTKENPYRRKLDIAQLHDFSAKGTYRVQLTYDDRWLAGADSGHWLGQFKSPVFQVVVDPDN